MCLCTLLDFIWDLTVHICIYRVMPICLGSFKKLCFHEEFVFKLRPSSGPAQARPIEKIKEANLNENYIFVWLTSQFTQAHDYSVSLKLALIQQYLYLMYMGSNYGCFLGLMT